MKNNRYYFVIVLRILLITLNSLILVWFFTQTSKPATTLFFLFLLIFQALSLIIYLNRVNRDLANFLIYLQEKDSSLVFSRSRVEKNFKNVMASLNEINSKIREAQLSREEKHQYLQAVIEHVETGIISINSNQKIDFINKAALDIFGISNLNSCEVLYRKFPEMKDTLEGFDSGKDRVIKINSSGRSMDLAVKAKWLRVGNGQIRIISLQNIKSELEERELESWKKLIRVLRHEIMNSITPITTLTTAIKRSFVKNSVPKLVKDITEANVADALSSAEVIEERSKGLISFVEKFKSITDLPKPVLKLFSVAAMFEKVQVLFRNDLKAKGIEISVQVEPDLQLNADEHLIEQVIINMFKNSLEATSHHGQITIKALRHENEKVIIQIIDNGEGIPEEDLENIFVPSFTTKENGMGVGLSISKQIIQLHKGEILVNSVPGRKTVFEIILG